MRSPESVPQDLLEHSKSVTYDKSGSHAVADDLEHRYSRVFDMPECGADAEQLAVVGRSVFQAGDDIASAFDDLLDLIVEVRKSCLHLPHITFKFVASAHLASKGTPKFEVFGNQFIGEIKIPAVPHLFVIAGY